MDWSFTWEKRGFRAKDAPDRLRVTLQGDRARKLAGIFAGTRGVGAELREAAFKKYSVQPVGYHSVAAADGSGAVARNFADDARADELGASHKGRNCRGDPADVDAAQQLAAGPHGL